MKTSTERTKTRFRSAIVLVLLLLCLALAHHTIYRSSESSDGVFVPDDVVKNTKIMLEAINLPVQKERLAFSCSDSVKHVANDLVVRNAGLSYEDAEAKLISTWIYFSNNGVNPKCTDLPQLIAAAYKLNSSLASNSKLDVDREVRLLHTQNINWDNQITCLYSSASNGVHLFMGGAQCKQADQIALNQDQVKTLKSFASPLMTIAKNRYRSGGAPLQLTMTIDPIYQAFLDGIAGCGGAQKKCPAFLDPIYSQVDYAAFTILDANSNEMLAVGCFGRACQKVASRELGILSSATIEVPPASTEKLLFAYALAEQNPGARSRIPYEIKTSGDVGGEVRKRNEWWEKAAICDLSKVGNSNCNVLHKTLEFAHVIGWNRKCSATPSPTCGSSGVLEPLGIDRFSPVAGRAVVSASKDGYYEDGKIGQGGFLNWATYDRIREGKEKPSNYKQLTNTSVAVQSVIGAGDNRVTSLGLGMLASGMYQSARFGYVKPVVLFKSDASSSGERVNEGSAKIVVDGMNKVPVGAEPGWQGVGTASNAFKNVMGRSCEAGCPLYGKTGTVGGKDPAYAGTTLFTGFFSVPELAAYVGAQTKSQRTLSIGVFVKPVKSNGTHYASNLSIALIRELLER